MVRISVSPHQNIVIVIKRILLKIGKVSNVIVSRFNYFAIVKSLLSSYFFEIFVLFVEHNMIAGHTDLCLNIFEFLSEICKIFEFAVCHVSLAQRAPRHFCGAHRRRRASMARASFTSAGSC